MKSLKIIILIFLFTTLNAGISLANQHYPDNNLPSYNQMMNAEIRSLVTYPQFAIEQKLEGFVLVSFNYNELGLLHVIEANSNSEELKNYVITKLQNLDLCSHARRPGNVYNMRFDFRLI
jgi:hypothetical protein